MSPEIAPLHQRNAYKIPLHSLDPNTPFLPITMTIAYDSHNGVHGGIQPHSSHLDGFGTRAIHAGSEPDPVTGAIIPALSLSTTFKQDAVGVHKVRLFPVCAQIVASRLHAGLRVLPLREPQSPRPGDATRLARSGWCVRRRVLLGVGHDGDARAVRWAGCSHSECQRRVWGHIPVFQAGRFGNTGR